MRPIRFVLLGALALVVSYFAAFVVSILGAIPLLWIGTVLSLAGILPGVLLATMVMWGSHCRSTTVGVLVGLAVGGIIVVESTHFRMARDLGKEAKGRYDIVPQYLHERMKNTHYVPLSDVGDRERAPRLNDSVDTAMNWMLWGIVNGATLSLCVAAGAAWSRRAYCDHCRKWKARERVALPIAALPALSGGLTTEGLQAALATYTHDTPDESEAIVGDKGGTPTVGLAVEFCDREHRQPEGCEVLLSADWGAAAGRRRRLFKRVVLDAEQIPVIAERVRGVR